MSDERQHAAKFSAFWSLVYAADDAADFLDDQAENYEALHGCTGDRTGDLSSPPMFCECDRCNTVDGMRIKRALLDAAVCDAKAALDALAPGSVAALVEALELSKTALEHNAPRDCWAAGPMTGDLIEDLIVCPGCRAIAAIDKALAPFKEVRR